MVPFTLIVNVFIYVANRLNKKYIYWPNSDEELQHITNGLRNYLGWYKALKCVHSKL